MNILKIGALTLSFGSAAAIAQTQIDSVMRQEKDGTYVVNTTPIARCVEGYHGNTPVEISIREGKIVGISALRNRETPQYFERVKREMLDKIVGTRAEAFNKDKVDGVTGATYSSEAVKENVKRGVTYYLEHR